MKKIVGVLFLLGFNLIHAQINQNFDLGGFLPVGWTEYHSGVNALKDTNARAKSPTKSALFDDEFGTDTSWMILSQLNNLTPNSELTFWQNQNYDTYYTYHGVWISTNSNNPQSGDFIQLDSLGAGTEDTWEKKTINLSAYSGQNIYLAFVYIGDFADEWYIDDIKVSVIGQVNCSPPTAITASNITPNSIQLNWTPVGGELSWTIEYGLAGFTPGTGLTINSSSSQITIPNLQANTFYDHYIKANCGGSNISFYSPVFKVKTACSVTSNEINIPYFEGFELTTEPTLPCGWKALNYNNDTITWKTSSDKPKNGQYSAYITYTGSASLSHNDWLFSPYIMVNDTSISYKVGFSFASKSGTAFPEKMEFYTAKSNTGGALINQLFIDTAILTNNLYKDTSFIFKFSDTGKHYFGFHMFSNGDQWDFMVDDFTFSTLTPTSVNEINKQNTIVLYPNPTSNLVNIESKTKIEKISVYTPTGVLVHQISVNNTNYELDLSLSVQGMYILVLETKEGNTIKKVIKE